jgi:hypothetical protein
MDEMTAHEANPVKAVKPNGKVGDYMGKSESAARTRRVNSQMGAK